MRNSGVRLFWAAGLLLGCGEPSQEASAPTPLARNAELAVDSAVFSFLAAEEARDQEAVIAHLWPEFHMLQDGRRADYDEVVSQIRSTMPSLQLFRSEWTDLKVQLLSDEVALTSFHFRDSVVTAEGDLIQSQGPTTLIWELRDGQWRIVFGDADHYPLDAIRGSRP